MVINEYIQVIIGVIAGVFVNIIAITVVCFCMREKKSKKQKEVFDDENFILKLLTINADQSYPQKNETEAIENAFGDNPKDFDGVAVIAMQEIDMSYIHLFCIDFLFGCCKTRENKVMTQWVNFFRGVFFKKESFTDAKDNTHFLLVGGFAMILINKTGKELTDLHFETWRYGIGKMLGNKSAVGVFFKVGEKSVGILGAHLSARDDKKRNEKRKKEVEMLMTSSVQIHGISVQVKKIDCLVFMGDLNFRVEGDISEQKNEESFGWSVEEFKERDQLRQYMRGGNCPLKDFKEFFELDVKFDEKIFPSYKFYTGEQKIHLKGDQKDFYVKDAEDNEHYLNVEIKKKNGVQNKPSLTERILIKVPGVELMKHELLLGVEYSDHKPLYHQVRVNLQADTGKSEFSSILDGTMLI